MRELLCLPLTARVTGSVQSDTVDSVLIMVDDPELPEQAADGTVVEAEPMFRKNTPVEFINWNIRKEDL